MIAAGSRDKISLVCIQDNTYVFIMNVNQLSEMQLDNIEYFFTLCV